MAGDEDPLACLRGARVQALEGHDLLEGTRPPLAPAHVPDPVDGREEHGLGRIGHARLHHCAPEGRVATVAVGFADLVVRAGRMEGDVASAEEPVVPAPRLEVRDPRRIEAEAVRRVGAPLRPPVFGQPHEPLRPQAVDHRPEPPGALGSVHEEIDVRELGVVEAEEDGPRDSEGLEGQPGGPGQERHQVPGLALERVRGIGHDLRQPALGDVVAGHGLRGDVGKPEPRGRVGPEVSRVLGLEPPERPADVPDVVVGQLPAIGDVAAGPLPGTRGRVLEVGGIAAGRVNVAHHAEEEPLGRLDEVPVLRRSHPRDATAHAERLSRAGRRCHPTRTLIGSAGRTGRSRSGLHRGPCNALRYTLPRCVRLRRTDAPPIVLLRAGNVMAERSSTATATRLADAARASRSLGFALALSATVFWSLAGLMIRLMGEATSWHIILYRSLGATAMVGGMIAIVHRGRVVQAIRLAGWPAVLAGVCSSASSVLFILALGRVTVANATFMGGITPFLTAIGAQTFLGERVPRRAWGAMALATIGVALMLGGGLALGRLSGNLFALGSAVTFAGHALFLRFNRQSDMLPAVLYAGLFGMLFGLLALGIVGVSPRLLPRDLGLALAMGVVQLGGGLVLYTRASRHLPAAELQLVSTAELVLAPLWVWIGVGEAPGAATLVGGGLVILAILAQALGARDRAHP